MTKVFSLQFPPWMRVNFPRHQPRCRPRHHHCKTSMTYYGQSLTQPPKAPRPRTVSWAYRRWRTCRCCSGVTGRRHACQTASGFATRLVVVRLTSVVDNVRPGDPIHPSEHKHSGCNSKDGNTAIVITDVRRPRQRRRVSHWNTLSV